MKRDPAEIEETQRLETVYGISDHPAIQAITDTVCGCGHVGTSWTTRQEADTISKYLNLQSTDHLLELGAGAGWPGLYLANQSGCRVTLIDLPETGLKIAMDRARTDGMADRVSTIVGDASDLPLEDQCFGHINHADLLCCLLPKRRVLEECRRVIRPAGRMAFSVISTADDLSASEFAQAVNNGPPFVECEMSYDDLLLATGWQIDVHLDITDAYEQACQRTITADLRHEVALRALLGDDEFEVRLENWRSKLATIRKGFIRREFFVVSPPRRLAALKSV
ncbi:MAG: class I SAM-dependent methyltransferase [Rhizobiaceae bacterium]